MSSRWLTLAREGARGHVNRVTGSALRGATLVSPSCSPTQSVGVSAPERTLTGACSSVKLRHLQLLPTCKYAPHNLILSDCLSYFNSYTFR